MILQTCEQRLLSPELRMVFDDDMRASARTLAHHALMVGGMTSDGADEIGRTGRAGRRGSGGGLQSMGVLRDSLVSMYFTVWLLQLPKNRTFTCKSIGVLK